MIQQVNLLHEDLRPSTEWLNSAQLLTLSLGFLGVLVLLSVVLAWQLQPLDEAHQDAKTQLAQMQAKQAILRARLPGAAMDNEEAELLQRQRDNAELLAVVGQADAVPFSAHFLGLSEAAINGLSLEHIELISRGQQVYMSLAGRTRQPVLVANLLEALAAQETFAGHRFATVNVEQDDGVVNFEIRAEEHSSS